MTSDISCRERVPCGCWLKSGIRERCMVLIFCHKIKKNHDCVFILVLYVAVGVKFAVQTSQHCLSYLMISCPIWKCLTVLYVGVVAASPCMRMVIFKPLFLISAMHQGICRCSLSALDRGNQKLVQAAPVETRQIVALVGLLRYSGDEANTLLWCFVYMYMHSHRQQSVQIMDTIIRSA